MGGETLLIAGLLLAGAAIYLLASSILSGNADEQALLWANGSEPIRSQSAFLELSRPLVHRFCLGFAGKIKNQRYRKSVERKIGTAGLEREINVDEFIGLQILWGVLFPLVLALLNFTLQLGYSTPLIFLLGGAGLYFPHMHAEGQRRARYSSIIADLPFFIDLLALSTEAGLDFVAGIRRIVDKAEKSILGEEFEKVLKDINLGSARADAFKKMSDRLDIPEVTSFIVVLNDSDAQGVSVGKVLKQQSIQMRQERFTRAEKAGAKASQLILVPLLIFILPAVFIMVFGPVILQFLGQG